MEMKLKNYIEIAVCIVTNDRNELLTVRKTGSTYYQLPGGKLEPQESAMVTLLRELKEELNLEFEESDFRLVKIHEADAVNERGMRVRGHVFRCVRPIPMSLSPNAELEEVRWVGPEEADAVKLANLLRQVAIPEWLGH